MASQLLENRGTKSCGSGGREADEKRGAFDLAVLDERKLAASDQDHPKQNASCSRLAHQLFRSTFSQNLDFLFWEHQQFSTPLSFLPLL